jgi:hypothetical protein
MVLTGLVTSFVIKEEAKYPGGPTVEDTTQMGQSAIQQRDKEGTQDDRKDVQG